MSDTASRTWSICMVGLSIAIIAISSWITIPLGPIPFTLQMFAIPLVIYVLRPLQTTAAIYIYVGLGALGLPLFSGMRGGVGVLLGPTGGFLIGYLIGVPLAAGLLYLAHRRSRRPQVDSPAERTRPFDEPPSATTRIKAGFWEFLAGMVFIFFAYLIGCIWYTFVAHVDFAVAFATCALPFVIPDLIKTLLAVIVAQPIQAALGMRYW